MALTDLDRQLLRRCLDHEPGAWNEFVDRFLGVIYHVIHHTCHLRGVTLQADDMEELAAEILSGLIAHDFRILRHFRGHASLATYLAVVARRIAVRQLTRRAASEHRKQNLTDHASREVPPDLQIESREEVEHLLHQLDGRDAELVRSFYLDHKSYHEISEQLGIPENSIGPTLSRIRARLRKAATQT